MDDRFRKNTELMHSPARLPGTTSSTPPELRFCPRSRTSPGDIPALTIALARTNFRASAFSNPVPDGSVRKAFIDLHLALRNGTIDAGRIRRLELRAAVTEAVVVLERSVPAGVDLSVLASPIAAETLFVEIARRRALGRVMQQQSRPFLGWPTV